jgi:hypothetical protein
MQKTRCAIGNGVVSEAYDAKPVLKKKKRRYAPFRECECETASCRTGGARPEDRHGDGGGTAAKADANQGDPIDSSSVLPGSTSEEETIRKERARPPEIKQILMPLKTIEPQGLNPIGDSEWVEIDVAVDSGATETVMSAETLGGVVDITEGPAFVRGVQYEVANGVQIPNLGERKFVGVTEEGVERKLTAQVCDVNKTLKQNCQSWQQSSLR